MLPWTIDLSMVVTATNAYLCATQFLSGSRRIRFPSFKLCLPSRWSHVDECLLCWKQIDFEATLVQFAVDWCIFVVFSFHPKCEFTPIVLYFKLPRLQI